MDDNDEPRGDRKSDAIDGEGVGAEEDVRGDRQNAKLNEPGAAHRRDVHNECSIAKRVGEADHFKTMCTFVRSNSAGSLGS